MGRITLQQAAAWCGGTVEEKYADGEFFGANNDTRVLQPGQLFIVLQGARDGHDFIPNAMEKGAAAVLCSRSLYKRPVVALSQCYGHVSRLPPKLLSLLILVPKCLALCFTFIKC